MSSHNSKCPDRSQKFRLCYWGVAFVSKKGWNSGNDIVNEKSTGIGKTCINFPSKIGLLTSVQAEKLEKKKNEFQCIMLKYYKLDLCLILVGRGRAVHGCSSHSNLEIEAKCLTKNLPYLNLNIFTTKNSRNKL